MRHCLHVEVVRHSQPSFVTKMPFLDVSITDLVNLRGPAIAGEAQEICVAGKRANRLYGQWNGAFRCLPTYQAQLPSCSCIRPQIGSYHESTYQARPGPFCCWAASPNRLRTTAATTMHISAETDSTI